MKHLLLLTLFLAGCTITGFTTAFPSESQFNHTLLFCIHNDCYHELETHIASAKTEIACALYSADSSLIRMLESKNATVSIVTDKKSKMYAPFVTNRNNSALMHNKFCVFDRQRVWTGSFNPYPRSTHDNVLIINSSLLADNYYKEFEELQSRNQEATTTTKMLLNQSLVENYFCPEDSCIQQLKRTLNKANSSILFATYSFTHPAIANELILRAAENISVRGIMENGGQYSQYEKLKANGIDVSLHDGTLLHHKFFIIDNKTVVTGSFNPTRNGNERNDENLLIIHDGEIAKRYTDEWQLLHQKKRI
jgi:phosphatidylserine/phosphatidylglycerophosphate/cardiolipin synthase-like enzyme